MYPDNSGLNIGQATLYVRVGPVLAVD